MARRQRLLAPAAVLAGGVLATVALRLRDPHEPGAWGLCPTAALGLACPGCGALRAVNDLTHGQLAEAASSNLLLVLALPFAALALVVWTVDRWRGTRRDTSALLVGPAGYAALALVVGFTLVRNLPAGAWLAP
ncbi:DUF2752 domain-containing protein [Nocardioides sp. SYSU DS0663]|uniref:DUF2752 domain-containing protein n=1 Tax=Nocardioides sp. SYSU DS0663 TaxID=3416445 RepID=UPI003F4C9C8A